MGAIKAIALEAREEFLREIQAFASEHSHSVLGRDVVIVEQLLDFLGVAEHPGKEMTAYCLSCKKSTTAYDGVEKSLSSGRKILLGSCSTCGTEIRRIIRG
jgi:hypothetical protein